jgi:hypothetical protein
MPLVSPILRFMWRYRGLLALGALIILGHIWLNDAIRAWDNWHKPVAYCDEAHKIPFIPADKCGGMSSCDRNAFIRNGVLTFGDDKPIPCPTQ